MKKETVLGRGFMMTEGSFFKRGKKVEDKEKKMKSLNIARIHLRWVLWANWKHNVEKAQWRRGCINKVRSLEIEF
jgi:hypothetical protein